MICFRKAYKLVPDIDLHESREFGGDQVPKRASAPSQKPDFVLNVATQRHHHTPGPADAFEVMHPIMLCDA